MEHKVEKNSKYSGGWVREIAKAVRNAKGSEVFVYMR